MALAASGTIACDEFSYEGFQKPLRFELFQDIPIVYLKLDNGATFRAAVDTASPLMIFARDGDGSKDKTSLRMLEPVECLADADCSPTPGRPNCDRATGRCLPVSAECTENKKCAGLYSNKPYCVNGACQAEDKECTKDTDCKTARRPTCSAGRCVLFNPRFVFHNLEHYDLPLQVVGLGEKQELGGLVGAPLLTNFVVRLLYDPPVPTITFLDEIPDSNEELADDCDHGDLLSGPASKLAGCTAVMHTPLHGGGLLQVGGETKDLGATRLVVDLCLQPEVFAPDKADATVDPAKQQHGAAKASGVATQAVISTGLGVTVISQSVLERLKPLLPGLGPQTPTTLHLPYGTEQVTTITINRAALVSNETRVLGPCSELALRRRLLLAEKVGLTQEDKALVSNNRINGASVALLKESLTLAVVAEDSRLIQGLRKELRSAAANVDMIIGGSLLKHLELEVDYPKSRTILRCDQETEKADCTVTPFCAHPDNSDNDAIICPQVKE